jgi:hypothetical protein
MEIKRKKGWRIIVDERKYSQSVNNYRAQQELGKDTGWVVVVVVMVTVDNNVVILVVVVLALLFFPLVVVGGPSSSSTFSFSRRS